MPFTTTAANSILDAWFNDTAFTRPTTVYMSVHSANPGDAGSNEATGGSYARQSVSWAAAATKAITNDGSAVAFNGMPAGTWTHVALWSVASAGSPFFIAALTASKTTGAGDKLELSVGDFDISLN